MARDRGPATDCRFLNRLQDHLDGRLPPPLAAELERHLAEEPACPACRDELASLRRVQATLRAAAGLPAPRVDRAAVLDRLRERLGPRRPRWALALGGVAAAAAALLALLLVPSSGPPAPPTADPGTAPERFPLLALAGGADGLVPGADGSAWVPADGAVRLAEGARLVVAPGAALVLAIDEAGAFRLRRAGGERFEAALERGRLAAHLGPGADPGVAVRTPAGMLEALGTAFVVRILPGEEADVALLEGRLRVSPTGRAPLEVEGPARFVLGAGGLAPLAPLSATEAAELMRVLPGSAAGDLRLAWLAYHAPARPVALPVRPAPSPAPDVQDPLTRARKLLAARRVDEARALLEGHLAGAPGDPRARMLYADALRLAGEATPARDAYLTLARAPASDAQQEAALFEAGLLELRALGAPARALGLFDELRRRFPRGLLRQEVAFHLAECYLALGDYRRARRALDDYLRLYPAGTQVEAARGWLRELEVKGWR